jgi:hypothetical protein
MLQAWQAPAELVDFVDHAVSRDPGIGGLARRKHGAAEAGRGLIRGSKLDIDEMPLGQN